MRSTVIAVIGTANPNSIERMHAFEVGLLLGKRGLCVLTGGLEGVMHEASRGAHEGGGVVLGIVPDGDPNTCNTFVDICVASGVGDARNAIIANTADGFIAVGGGFGTLSEIAFALKRGKPVVGLGSWTLNDSRMPLDDYEDATTPQQAVTRIITRVG